MPEDHRMMGNAVYTFEDFELLSKSTKSYNDVKTKPSGEVIYDVTYNFDSFGRRKTPYKPNATEAHLFFGCSFTFGDGLDDNQTLPWHFSEISQFQTFNYAFRGHGPHHMLAQIRQLDLNSQLPNSIEKVDVSFTSYSWHTERYLGSFVWIGRNAVNEPYFTLKDGQTVYQGSFAKSRPVTTFLYWLLYHSQIARTFFQTLGDDLGPRSQNLFCAIVNDSQRRLQDQLKDRFWNFYLIVSPLRREGSNYYEGVKKCLNSEIKVVEPTVPFEKGKYPDEFFIDPVWDRHPSSDANRWLAEKLLKELE